MRKVLLMGLVLVLTAVASGQMTLIEDFSAYPLGETIHDKGDWTNYAEPHWQAQRNNPTLTDHGYANVVQKGNKVALELINRSAPRGDVLQTVYTAMNLGSNHYIYNQGTIYIRFMAETDGDTLVAANNYFAGWDYGGWETGDAGAPSFQGTATGNGASYANNCMLVELSAEDFRAFNGGGYEQHAPTKAPGVVYELWMQFDTAAKAARFYLCEDQGTPTVMLTTAGGEWWGFRAQHTSVENLKFFSGLHAYDTPTYIESIAVNSTEYVTDRPAENVDAQWEVATEPVCNPGDADGDGDVDLDDFVVLKNNFGTTTGATCAMGDFDGDGDVDLDDFVLLKSNFGATY